MIRHQDGGIGGTRQWEGETSMSTQKRLCIW